QDVVLPVPSGKQARQAADTYIDQPTDTQFEPPAPVPQIASSAAENRVPDRAPRAAPTEN
ncbi:MAG TPA: hypothetical protein VMZ33_03605, partial [Candidatus Limnocylindrales bacterium]|nr:hypothetical protein [Candidatus Limnocylindrales bacterium]